MPKLEKKKVDKEPKQYFQNVPRKFVYGGLLTLALIAAISFLCVPHYKPLKLATDQEIQYAHGDIIRKFFLASTNCKDDSQDKTSRIKEFNQYFQVNQYANRALIRGCNDQDSMLYKDDKGKWQKSDVNIVLGRKHNPKWQKECLLYDISEADTKAKPENASIDASNFDICEGLVKESYIEVNFKLGIHFHF